MYLPSRSPPTNWPVRLAISIYICAAIILQGCGTSAANEPWPPISDRVNSSFEEKRLAFELIASRMEESELSMVSYLQPERIRLLSSVEENADFKEPKDKKAWNDLLGSVEFGMFVLDGNSVKISEFSPTTNGSSEFLVSYVRQSTPPLKPCVPKYSDIKCGMCREDLGKNWYLIYSWRPTNTADEQREELVGDKVITSSNGAAEQEQSKCMADGLRAIGYFDSDFD